MYPMGEDKRVLPLKPTCKLGPTVLTDPDHGKVGVVVPIRWNPLEGSTNGPAQVSICGNVDYQGMARTLREGFDTGVPDRLRDPTTNEWDSITVSEQADARFEMNLAKRASLFGETTTSRTIQYYNLRLF